jgi:hypothetical protein
MSKKQIRTITELVLGLALGVPSIENIFQGVFMEMWKAGNKIAVIGLFTSLFVGIILTLDSIAVAIGYKNLGDLVEVSEDE